MSSYQQLIQQASTAAIQAGAFIRGELKKFNRAQIERKSFNQLVSYVDVTAEKMLVKALQETIPEAGFITEEQTAVQEKDREWCWIIDPLDGTTNFMHGLPVFSVSIGLQHNGVLVGGVVYEVNRDECFYAWKDGGAWLNGERIHVSASTDLGDCLIATGFPYYDFKRMPQYLEVLTELMRTTHGLRRMGSAAVDLAYVACGRFDAFFEYSLSPWDVAGGIVLVQEAGGIVSDFKGGTDYLFGRSIVATAPGIDAPFTELIRSKFI